MTNRDFCYWLQGFFELNNPETLNEEQTLEIKKHLYNVFQHECEKIRLEDVKDFYSIPEGIIAFPNSHIASC